MKTLKTNDNILNLKYLSKCRLLSQNIKQQELIQKIKKFHYFYLFNQGTIFFIFFMSGAGIILQLNHYAQTNFFIDYYYILSFVYILFSYSTIICLFTYCFILLALFKQYIEPVHYTIKTIEMCLERKVEKKNQQDETKDHGSLSYYDNLLFSSLRSIEKEGYFCAQLVNHSNELINQFYKKSLSQLSKHVVKSFLKRKAFLSFFLLCIILNIWLFIDAKRLSDNVSGFLKIIENNDKQTISSDYSDSLSKDGVQYPPGASINFNLSKMIPPQGKKPYQAGKAGDQVGGSHNQGESVDIINTKSKGTGGSSIKNSTKTSSGKIPTPNIPDDWSMMKRAPGVRNSGLVLPKDYSMYLKYK